MEAPKTQHAIRYCLPLKRVLSKWKSTQIICSSVALNISLKQQLPGSPQAVVLSANHDSALPDPLASAQNNLQSPSPGSSQQPTKPVVQPNDLVAAGSPSADDKNETQNHEHHFLYLCIPRDPLRFKAIDCHDLHNDAGIFKALKAAYDQTRGFTRRWLSVWRYDRCEFYEFRKHARDLASLVDRGFPDATDYSYAFEPRPPPHMPPRGPISAGEFRDRYYHAGSYGALRTSLASWKPLTDPENGSSDDALKALPKWKGELAMDKDDREEFFGLLAVETISCSGVAAYVLLANSCGLVFFAWWLSRHKGDLQNAAVPLAILPPLMGILVSLLLKKR